MLPISRSIPWSSERRQPSYKQSQIDCTIVPIEYQETRGARLPVVTCKETACYVSYTTIRRSTRWQGGLERREDYIANRIKDHRNRMLSEGQALHAL